MNNKQKLGIKVFYYYLSKKISVGIFLFVVSIFITSLNDAMVVKADLLFSTETSVLVVKYFVYAAFFISTLFTLYGLLSSWLSYISCDFSLDENAFNIRRGFFTKKEISIPYRQIQNINIEQSLSQKMMGIGKLVILTEGSHSEISTTKSEGSFDIIDYDLAHKIREFILQRANLQIVKDVEPKNGVI